MNSRRHSVLFVMTALGVACAPGPGESRSVLNVAPRSGVVQFVYGTTDGGEFSSATTLGRPTAVLFVTTFDLASQVEARRLNEVLHLHRPRANAGAVVLEPPRYAPLADAFRTSLGLIYPVAIADDETRNGQGPFGHVDRVPTLIALDRAGREVWRKSGLANSREIESALAQASKSAN